MNRWSWWRLGLGLAVPGGGLLALGDWRAFAWTAFAVGHLAALSWADSTAMVTRFDPSLSETWSAVQWAPQRFGPQAVWALAAAVAVHVLAAWAAARRGG